MTIFIRCLRMRCPNCDRASLLRSWFHLHVNCPRCGMVNGKESGFTLGTTSIGYVISLLLVLLPVVVLAVRDQISFLLALVAGGLGSLVLPLVLYPLLLCWVVGTYYGFLPGELPVNQNPEDS